MIKAIRRLLGLCEHKRYNLKRAKKCYFIIVDCEEILVEVVKGKIEVVYKCEKCGNMKIVKTR